MRLLHLSDLHFRHNLNGSSAIPARDSRGVYARLEHVLERASIDEVDAVVVSGDIIDYPFNALGDPVTQAAALKDLSIVRSLLDRFPCPYLCIPGNHDLVELHERIVGDISLDRRLGEYRLVAFCDREDDLHVPHRQGAERERFLNVLDDKDQAAQIHLQHFVVWPELNEGYPHTYAESAWICDAVAKSGKVALMLSGHYHLGTDLVCHQGVWFSTVPAFCETPYPYRVYEQDGCHVVMREYQVLADQR